jgi:hypothetical protein
MQQVKHLAPDDGRGGRAVCEASKPHHGIGLKHDVIVHEQNIGRASLADLGDLI